MNISNILSISRIILAPIILSFLLIGSQSIVFILLIVAGLTDFLDGYFARKFNQVTRIGIFLDSVADKILVLFLFIGLIINYDLAIYLVFLMFSREIVVLSGRLFLYFWDKDVDIIKDVPVTFLGKITTVFQLITIVFIIFGYRELFFIILTIALSILTAVHYVAKGIEFLYAKNRI